MACGPGQVGDEALGAVTYLGQVRSLAQTGGWEVFLLCALAAGIRGWLWSYLLVLWLSVAANEGGQKTMISCLPGNVLDGDPPGCLDQMGVVSFTLVQSQVGPAQVAPTSTCVCVGSWMIMREGMAT